MSRRRFRSVRCPPICVRRSRPGSAQGRSPDVMAATNGTDVVTNVDGVPVSWPSTSAGDDRVPIVFWGTGVNAGALPDGTGLDQIAPTLAAILGFDRPHPQVRAGVAVADVASAGVVPRLVVMIAWKGVGTSGLRSTPTARHLHPELARRRRRNARRHDGLAAARSGGVAHDDRHRRAAIAARDHGGLRHGTGAASPDRRGAPGRRCRSCRRSPRTSIGTSRSARWSGSSRRDAADRGLIGGTWYPDHDRDDVRIGGDPLDVGRRRCSPGDSAPTTSPTSWRSRSVGPWRR